MSCCDGWCCECGTPSENQGIAFDVPKRIRRLRALADGYRKLAKRSNTWGTLRFHDGKNKERARIVAKMRAFKGHVDVQYLADEIERGE